MRLDRLRPFASGDLHDARIVSRSAPAAGQTPVRPQLTTFPCAAFITPLQPAPRYD